MKNSLLPVVKGIAMVCLLGGGAANAANFVATASGAWTSSATWGGTAPSTTITADNITIPAGITVTLDQSVALSGTASMAIGGELSTTATQDLSVTGGATLSGAGILQVDSLALGGVTASLGYTGNIMARTITSQGLLISSGATILATESVKLDNGLLNLTSVNFTLANGGTVYMAGGQLNVGIGANLNLNTYDVEYIETSATTGLELGASGLRNVTVDVGSSGTVTLSSDVNMDDTLHLVSGTLSLNGNDLTFSGNGNVGAGGSGSISTTSGSNISIMSNNSFIGDLRFSSSANTVNNLTINMGSPSVTANIGSDLNVDGTLSLQSGKLDVNGNSLILDAGASVNGGSSNSYVITSDWGDLTMNLSAGTTDSFQIGTSASFAPIAVTINPASSGGNVSATVTTGLLTGIEVGANLAATQPVVNATWAVTTDASSNINMNISPIWSSAMEVNGFNRTEAFVSMSADGTWDVQTAAAASTTANGMFSLTRSNVTSDIAAYSVMDKDAVNSVKEVNTAKGFDIYPNPVVNTLHFRSATALRAPVQVNIYDIAGHLVKAVVAENNAVSVADLAEGFYTAQFISGEFKAVEKFVKQ